MLKKHIAVLRYGTVEEVAGLVAYLTGTESGYITGANLMIDGRFSA
ncbi:SDR family oxidoreductase [Nostoc sp.]